MCDDAVFRGNPRVRANAYVKARAGFTDDELLQAAQLWLSRDERIAWEYREAWALRCVEWVR